jgi:PAS domain S-box-containing protein
MRGKNTITILLVEDEAIMAMAEKSALEKYGYTVITVNTGEKAIEAVKTTLEISLILMDIDLGKGIDGTEAAAIILKDYDIPIVFLSSHSEREIVEKTEKISSYGYVVKSSSITVLDASIKMAFKLYDAFRKEKGKEEALRESERHLRNSQKIAHLGSWSLDVATNQVMWTEELYNMYGFDPAIPPPPYTEHMKLFTPGSWKRLATSLANTKETGIPYELELETVKRDGSNGWMWVRGEAIKDSEGNTISLWGAAQDITERKLAEAALQEKNEEYSALNEELRSSVEELQEANEEMQVQNEELRNSYDAIRQAELALHKSEEKFRRIVESSPVAMYFYRLESDGRLVLTGANPSADRIIGIRHTELIGKTIEEAFPLLATSTIPVMYRRVAKGEIGTQSFEIPYKDDRFSGFYNVTVFQTGLNTIVVDFTDITERKQAEEELKRIEWLLTDKPQVPEARKHAYTPPYGDMVELNTCRLILDSVGEQTLNDIVNDYLNLLDTSAAVYEKNGDYALGIFSSGWCRFMDAASRSICNTNDNRKALDCGQWHCHESCWSRASKTAIETGQPADIECSGGIRLYAVPIRLGDEIIGAINFGYGDPPRDERKLRELATNYQVGYEELRVQAMNYESRPPYIIDLAKQRLIASARLLGDITGRKQAEAKMKELLAEKELILKEVNHRIKNNMNAMKSLLRLQAGTMNETSTAAALEEAGNRMQSMEILYDQLYQTTSFSELSIKTYVSSLVDAIITNFPQGNLVTIEKRIDDFILDAKRLQPLGIIINELLSNSMKYAFTDKSKGMISVSVQLKEGHVTMTLWDNGIGIPVSIDFENSTGFGLTLVQALAAQLYGKIRIERAGGTRVVLDFDR